MHNKKILGAIAALTVSVALIGGTLAWFTSRDEVANIFATGGIDNPENANGNGVEIYEQFTPPTNILPGSTTTKLVQTQNTTTYDSFIRVKITKSWTSPEGNELDPEMIELSFGNNLGDTDGKWLKGNDGYYYYMGKVAGGKFTNALLESVTLSTEAGNEYRDAKYQVLVEAESIQADNDAHNSAWEGAGQTVTAKLDAYEEQVAGGNDSKLNDKVIITNTKSRPEPANTK